MEEDAVRPISICIRIGDASIKKGKTGFVYDRGYGVAPEEERLRYLFLHGVICCLVNFFCGSLSGSVAVLDRLLVFLDNFFSKDAPFLQAILDKVIKRLVINEFSE
jgi:hypothetical protein